MERSGPTPIFLCICLRDERDVKGEPKSSLPGDPLSNHSQLEKRGDITENLAAQAGGAGRRVYAG